MKEFSLYAYIENGGCIEGQLSSTYVKQFFEKNGLNITIDLKQADLVVFYACGLTMEREKESLNRVKQIQSVMKPTARLVVWGCLVKINPQSLLKIYDGPLVGPTDIRFFKDLLKFEKKQFDILEIAGAENILVPSGDSEKQYIDPLTDKLLLLENDWDRFWGRARKNIKFVIRVAEGCTGGCTYCSEKCAFGSIKSRPIENITSDFRVGLSQGYNLFSLMATDLGIYGKDIGCNLIDLLNKIIQTGKEQRYQIILNQVNPFHLSNLYSGLEEIFASNRIYSLCSPVQSGNNRILKLMGRPYTAEEWRGYMGRIQNTFPKIRLVTQFMVGFPTETDEDFKATLKLLDFPIFFDNIYVFKFSKRPSTYASKFTDQVPEIIKEARKRQLLRKYAYRKACGIMFKALRSSV